MTFDWFCRSDDEELELADRPGVGRLRRKLSTPAVADIAALAGAGTPSFVPIGPSAALFGATVRRAPVAGRVRALAVSSDGRRAYAGTSGGLWYTADAGDTWIPLDASASSRELDGALHDARALPVSALSVQFGAAANGADDVVFAGTGDAALESTIGPDGGRGIGIRTAVGPAPQVIAGNAPWALEARNLAGAIVLALVRDRANDIWAATTDGLYKRPAANRENWEQIFEGLVWDVDVTRGVGAEPQRLWVASEGKVQWSADGADFNDVALPDDFPLGERDRPAIGRIRLAAARDADPPHVWALASGARLWRIDAAGASPVEGVPNDLSGLRDADRADLGLAVACAPANVNDVIVAGGLTRTETPERAASVYRSIVARLAGGSFSFFGGSSDTRVPPSLAGIGVPGGVHAIAFATADPRQLWIATDGGVFRSRDASGAFEPRSVGLPTFEIEQITDHARAEALLMGGAQVSGILRAAGIQSWATDLRDRGGGVAIDPADGRRIAAQDRRAKWLLSADGRAFAPITWFNAPATSTPDVVLAYDAANREEDRQSARASTPAAIVTGGVTQLAIGTRRVWYSDDWRAWRTLPTILQDPSALDAAGRAPRTDQDLVEGELRVLRWATADQLYALTTTNVYLYRRTAPTTWVRTAIYDGPALKPKKRKSRGNQIPPEMPLTNVAVHDAARGSHGSLYVTTARSFEDDNERHVWWFDGEANWYACGLDVGAPAYAVAIDPAHPERVFVGTSIGIYRGVFQEPAAAGQPPTWIWTRASGGLPEAPCVALSVHTGARLLRAAIWGRGVFESPLDGAPAEPGTIVFLRAHEFDWRRTAIPATPRGPIPAGVSPPYAEADYQELRLDASPDIRVRRAPGQPPPAIVTRVSAFAQGTSEPRTFEAFAIQSALRRAGDAIVPVTGIEDAAFKPAVERWLERDENNTAAGWNALTGRGTLGNIYPLFAPTAFRETVAAAPAPTRQSLGVVAASPFAGRDLTGLVLRFGNRVREIANRGVATIITANTDDTLTFLPVPATVAQDDEFEIEEKTPGTIASVALVDEPDADGTCSCQTHTGRSLVDVTVRTRTGPIAAGRVRVALLRGPFAGTGAAVTPLPGTWVDSLRDDIAQPVAARGAWLPAGWSYFNDTTREILAVPGVLDARTPAVVTFEGTLPEGRALLFAAVIADDDLLNAAVGDVWALARDDRHVALRSVRAFAHPGVTNFAFFDWHSQAALPASAADYDAPVPDDRHLVRVDDTGALRPKTRLHLCFMEHAVLAFEVTFPAGTLWDASWSIEDSTGTVVARHPNFPAARAPIATGSYAWRWDGRRDPAGGGAGRGRLVVEGVYRSRLSIRRRVAGGGPVFEYTAEIRAEGKPYNIYVEGIPKNDEEIGQTIAGGDVFRPAGGADNVGQRIPRDSWILVYRGQVDEGHCVFLGHGILEATEIEPAPIGGAVATPHDRPYKGFVRRNPGAPAAILIPMDRPDRCQIIDLGPPNQIDLRNPGGDVPNNPFVNTPPALPGGTFKAGVQAHGGSNIWSADGLSVGCTAVSPRAALPTQVSLLRSLGSEFGTWGGAGQNAANGGPDFFNKQTKRAAATPAEARTDALLADDHGRPVLAPPALAGGVEPLHMQATFQEAAFGGFIAGELPLENVLVADEPAVDADLTPQARIRCVLRDYRRGSAYHIYHHGVIVRHRAAPAAPNYDIDLWVPRKVIRGWNSPIPGDDHSATPRPLPLLPTGEPNWPAAGRRHHDPLPENRRNVLVRNMLQVRWYVQHTPPGGMPAAVVFFVGTAAGAFAALLPGHHTRTWLTGGALAAGRYESVCEYQLQLEPHGANHEWHPELAVLDVIAGGGALLEMETERIDPGTGLVFFDGRAVVQIVNVP